MANSKEIKNRIKSVKNTKKITKAMELVAASKMKRAVSSTLASRLYAEYSWEVLTSIANSGGEITHPLFTQRKEVNNILLILITSNRGLCGSYNSQVIKKAFSFVKEFGSNPAKTRVDILPLGKKGAAAFMRLGMSFASGVFELPDSISLRDIVPVAKMIVDDYQSGDYDKVYVAYTDFISALTQKPNIKQLLPVSKDTIQEFLDFANNSKIEQKDGNIKIIEPKTNYLFEGDMQTLLGSLAEKLTRMQIYQMMLESNASEQSSRMVAMKNASEASGEMISDLTLVFNKARQASITQEISEISAGMVSIA